MKTQHKISEYDQQAIDFLESTGTALDVKFSHAGPYFAGETDHRDIYTFTLKNKRGEYSGTFGDSLLNSMRAKRQAAKLWEKPSAYSILACMTKHDPGTFVDFCADFGYDDQPLSDYPKVLGIYQSVVNEYRGMARMFTPEQLEQLADIN